MRAKRVTRLESPAWRDAPVGQPAPRSAVRLDGHEDLRGLIRELAAVVQGCLYLRRDDFTVEGCEREDRALDAMGTRELSWWVLDELGIDFDRSRSDVYLLSRATAAMKSAVRDMQETVDTEVSPEVAALFAVSPAVASARQRHLDSFHPRGCSRAEFVERERNAWRVDHGPLAASGRPMSEIEREIAAAKGEI